MGKFLKFDFLSVIYYKYFTERKRGVNIVGTVSKDRMSTAIGIFPIIRLVLMFTFGIIISELFESSSLFIQIIFGFLLGHITSPFPTLALIPKDLWGRFLEGALKTPSILGVLLFKAD